jgi:hypothetical protein
MVIRTLLYMFSECKCHRLEYLGWLSTSKRVGLLQSPNLMIIALFLKYQTDSPRSGLESGIQIYLLGYTSRKNIAGISWLPSGFFDE